MGPARDPHAQPALAADRVFESARGVPLQFAIIQCEERDRYRHLVESHGGLVINWNGQNLHAKLAPNRVGAQEPNMTNITWVEDCIRTGQLLPLEGYVITQRVPAGVKRKTRVEFSAADDELVRQTAATTAAPDGNVCWQRLAEAHPHHTWQSWRNRWVKNLKQQVANQRRREMGLEPVHVPEPQRDVIPPVPLVAAPVVPREEALIERGPAKQAFTRADDRKLMANFNREENWDYSGNELFQKFERKFPTRTWQSWRSRWVKTLKPRLEQLGLQGRRAVDEAAGSEAEFREILALEGQAREDRLRFFVEGETMLSAGRPIPTVPSRGVEQVGGFEFDQEPGPAPVVQVTEAAKPRRSQRKKPTVTEIRNFEVDQGDAAMLELLSTVAIERRDERVQPAVSREKVVELDAGDLEIFEQFNQIAEEPPKQLVREATIEPTREPTKEPEREEESEYEPLEITFMDLSHLPVFPKTPSKGKGKAKAPEKPVEPESVQKPKAKETPKSPPAKKPQSPPAKKPQSPPAKKPQSPPVKKPQSPPPKKQKSPPLKENRKPTQSQSQNIWKDGSVFEIDPTIKDEDILAKVESDPSTAVALAGRKYTGRDFEAVIAVLHACSDDWKLALRLMQVGGDVEKLNKDDRAHVFTPEEDLIARKPKKDSKPYQALVKLHGEEAVDDRGDWLFGQDALEDE